MLIMADGSYLGLLSGGCLEADLKLHAQQVIESGAARAIEYDMRGPDDILFGIGAGCEGAMRVLLEPAHAAQRGGRRVGCRGTLHGARTRHLSRCGSRFHHDAARHLRLGIACRRVSRRRRNSRSMRRPRARFSSITAAIACALSSSIWLRLRICWCAAPDRTRSPWRPRRAPWGGGCPWSIIAPAYADARRFPGATVVRADARALGTVIDLAACHAVVVMSHHLDSDVAYLRELSAAGLPRLRGSARAGGAAPPNRAGIGSGGGGPQVALARSRRHRHRRDHARGDCARHRERSARLAGSGDSSGENATREADLRCPHCQLRSCQ